MTLNIDLSVEEIIATLNRSNLPTVLIEGKDDAIIYRKLEEDWAALRLSIFPTGGREKVLQVFKRRNELKAPNAIIYIVDRDYWIYSHVPEEFICERFLITAGYSIENEVITDGEILKMMTPTERDRFSLELKQFVRWYALALHRNLSGKEASKYDLHPDHLMEQGRVKDEFLLLEPKETYPEEFHDHLLTSYLTHLRGKSLLALMLKQLSYGGRDGPRHNHKQLMETVKARPGKAISKIFSEVSNLFSSNENLAV